MKVVRNAKGFTLIELIMIIVILGILSAIAIPKYIDMKTDAQKATARGVLGALASADAILFANNVLRGSTGNYTDDSIVAAAQISGGATATLNGVAGQGTITVPGTASYTFSYTAHSGTASAGKFDPGDQF